MANRGVRIVVRTKSDGKRSWLVANGKSDPPGPYYLRQCVGSKPKYIRAGVTYDEAEVAKIRLEKKLRVEAVGGVVPAEAPVGPTFHRCDKVLDTYLAYLRTTTKRNGRRYKESAIVARESDINAFLEFSKRVYVEQISRTDLLRYKAHLYAAGRANATIYNKFMSITVWLRHNQVIRIVDLLQPNDWPLVAPTKPNPYHPLEIDAMKWKASRST